MAYYDDKITDLQRLFGCAEVTVDETTIQVADRVFQVVDDVILALPGERQLDDAFAPEIQYTFGREWETFDRILPEHRNEFGRYFDLIDLLSLSDAMVCDLGCGMGRWSYFLAPWCRRMVLVDFSDAIFVARRNLAGVSDAIFVMGDVSSLPFADDCCDFAFSLGVLHHLPIDALEAVGRLRRFSPHLLVYLYYALDNRPAHFRVLLRLVTSLRKQTSRVRHEKARSAITTSLAYGVYAPLLRLGATAKRVGLQSIVPLADTYAGKSMARIRQDVYDRFFTSIEQRVSRREIEELTTHFSKVRVSEAPPYWHFECIR